MPHKPIPPNRDRLQSRILVWIAVPVLCYLVIEESWQLFSADANPRADLAVALATSLLFALFAWRLKAATPMAAWCGGMICFLVAESFPRILITTRARHRSIPSIFYSGLAPLLLLFIVTFYATKLGRDRKENAGLAESRKGRNAAQVIANLGAAALMASFWGGYIYQWINVWVVEAEREVFVRFSATLLIPMLAALTEATADTVSSEIGQAFGGTPFLLTTFRRVPAGTDGAITPIGTAAGIAAGAIVALSGIPALGMNLREALIALAAGTAGLFFDSLLGATLERRGWIGNDLVNFSSTAFAAALALLSLRSVDPLFR